MDLGDIKIGELFRNLENINFVQIGLIIVVAWLLIFLAEKLIPWLAERMPSRFRLRLLPVVPLWRLVVVLAATLQIFTQLFRPDWQNMLTLGAAGVLAVGFAFKDFISSLVAGMVNLFERPCRVGDWVEIDGVYGEIKSLHWRSLRILTPDDTLVTIPNSRLWTHNIHNSNDGSPTLMCVASFYLKPDHDGALVLAKLRDVALTSPYVHLERPILVVADEKPWASHYRVKAYPTDGRDQFRFVTDLTVRAKESLKRAGVRFADATAAVGPAD